MMHTHNLVHLHGIFGKICIIILYIYIYIYIYIYNALCIVCVYSFAASRILILDINTENFAESDQLNKT